MTETAAIYARISEDPREVGAGVQRQQEDCEALIRARGWELVGTYADNNVAVLKPGASRPGYAALLTAVRRGEVTRVVAYGLSRLVRNRRERAELIELLGQKRVSVALVKGSDLDLSSAAGRAVAGLLGEMDTMESEIKAERVARAALQRAEQGKASGHVAYGWHRVKVRNATGDVIDWRDEVDPEQAKVVNEIVDRLLGGEAIKALVTDFNERRVPPPGRRRADGEDPRWHPSTIRKIALRASNAGDRVHHGKVLGTAAWAPIVDRDKHDRVTALLTDPRRATTRSGARKHLLSYGIGECGACGARLRVIKRGGNDLYTCDAPRGCVGRRVEWVDELVREVVVERLSRPDARDLIARDDGAAMAARERAEALRAKLLQVQDDRDNDLITREQYLRSTARHRAELDEIEKGSQRVVTGLPSDVLASLVGPKGKARRWWEDPATSVTQRRALLEALDITVVIKPGRGGPGFKPELIKILPWETL